MNREIVQQPTPAGFGANHVHSSTVTAPRGSLIDIRRTASDKFVVTVDMCVQHQCADMAAVIGVLNDLQQHHPPAAPTSASRR